MKKICCLGCSLLTLGLTMLTSCSSGKTIYGDTSSTKVLQIGTESTFDPFEYQENGKVVGFDMDLMDAFGKSKGYKIEVNDMDFDGIVLAIETGKIDIGATGLSITDERKENINFSIPYYTAGQVVICKSDSSYASLTSVEDLNDALNTTGTKLGYQIGNTVGDYIDDNLKNATGVSYQGIPTALMDLTNGKINAILCDIEPAKTYAGNDSNYKVMLEIPLSEEDYGFGINKDNTALKAELDDFLNEYMESEEWDALIEKYF